MLTHPQPISVQRHELYQKVWSQPMTTLAHEYGISDVGLAKICRKLNIPYPGRGYWRRKETGKAVKQLPLPPNADPAKQSATIRRGFQAQPVDHFSVEAKERIQAEEAPEQKIEVPDRLVKPHRLLSGRMTELRSLQVDDYGAIWSGGLRQLNLRVSPQTLRRALRLMNTLFYALEARGYQFLIEDGHKSSLRVRIHGEPIEFSLEEKFRRIERPQVKNKDLQPWEHERYQYLATGDLFLKITEWWGQGLRKTWSDGKTAKVETCLNDFIIGLIKVAEVVKAERLKREQEERVRLEAEQRRRDEEMKRQEELARREGLIKEAARWTQAQQVRAYIGALKEKVIAQHGEIQSGSQADQWLTWANRQADRLDPLSATSS